ncbi:uncharacterized protein PFL1_05521 [Pseudozyma flocculosa PF-1]|uniref:Related to 3-hydroxyacyl-CoA dehydrogenase n=2 Tax=Pseudozyma flocculosa TaxID=84751 RepID=A0A5C3F9T0_9BASI|nr:uncharacterized protein PFL1_05521 [Pseudozyma flocculosa PF-1]EPQ26886.1 hypothetical protein PFL1_05521 [Pseudozyma flocculosa PF-1]SPO41208.1 related to 3-hydroxyacyl-CoA dehydrogenase [Pseudozyma flocculosa]
MQICNHVYYVTGGASGLGAATVELLHSLGAYVGILDLDLDRAEKLAAQLNATTASALPGNSSTTGQGNAPRAAAFRVDVCSEEDVVAALAGCDRLWTDVPVGGVVNCGGVGMAGKVINAEGEPFDLETFRKVVDINLIGTFNVTRLVAARLVRDLAKPIPKPTASTKELGVIINTASAAALEGQSGQAAYAASKGGVLSMTLPLSRDLAWFGIRSMTLTPALFSTPMMQQLPDRAKAQILKSAEFPVRFGEPDEFAHAVKMVIENPMLNGSYIRLDGATRLGKL